MLRVGLTGDLGSGKSTVARMLAEHGAVVFSSDDMGRRLMQPGEAVYTQIVDRFGVGVVEVDGSLDRGKLAALAFDPRNPRVEELNAIVHPAVLRIQATELAELERRRPDAIVVIESALIFSTRHAPSGSWSGSWRDRFDQVLLVVAPEEQEVARFVDRIAAGRTLNGEERSAIEADAHRRLTMQRTTADYSSQCIVIHNDGDIEQLEQRVEAAWKVLVATASQV